MMNVQPTGFEKIEATRNVFEIQSRMNSYLKSLYFSSRWLPIMNSCNKIEITLSAT